MNESMQGSFLVEIRRHGGKWELLCAAKSAAKAELIARSVVRNGTAAYAKWGYLELVYVGKVNEADA